MGNVYKFEATGLDRPPPAARLDLLTPRQLDVLALLCAGLPNKQIGRRLNIASATVKIHVAHILRALNVESRLQAVIAARSIGFEFNAGEAEQMRREAVTAPRYPTVLRLLLGETDPPLTAAAG